MADPTKYFGFSTGSAWRDTLRAGGGVRAVILADGQKVDVDDDQAAVLEAVLSTDDDLSPAEAARFLGVSRPMVMRWIGEGSLADRPVGTHHRIPRTSVVALSERRAAAGRAVTNLREAAETGHAEAVERVNAARQRAAARVAARDARRAGAARA